MTKTAMVKNIRIAQWHCQIQRRQLSHLLMRADIDHYAVELGS